MTARCFVSIDLPKSVKEYLGSLALHDIYWIKWMKPANFHITLNFLGELGPERVAETKEILASISSLHKPFSIRLDRIETELDMLWLMPARPTGGPEKNDALEALLDDLKSQLRSARLGKSERRSYVPHILLGRSKTGRHMRPVIENFEPQEFVADRINLYESELTPGSATHRLIESFPLG